MKEKNRFCWKLVSDAIRWEYELIEHKNTQHSDDHPSEYIRTTDDGIDINIEPLRERIEAEQEFKYAAGAYNFTIDNIEFMTLVCDIDVIDRAEEYASDEDNPDLAPIYVQESDMEPDPRITSSRTFRAFHYP